MKKALLIGIVSAILAVTTVSTILAAQGQITEVNPSGRVTVDTGNTPFGAKGVIVDVNPSGVVSIFSPGRNDLTKTNGGGLK